MKDTGRGERIALSFLSKKHPDMLLRLTKMEAMKKQNSNMAVSD